MHGDNNAADSDGPVSIPAICPVILTKESLLVNNTSRRQSLFVPQEDSEDSDESSTPADYDESRKQLNHFLQLRDVSPVRHVLSVPWNTAHERTKRRYVGKAEQCISAMLDVLAPENSQELWKELCDRHTVGRGDRKVSTAEVKKRRSFSVHLQKAT
ncbi:hypothetical protein OS493_020675 [Desmophyllum pertusum]|uniref:Uncharacterized protein n=1 Tax=Desmophyllum pertusum TaxID=174260 RepID=A0A9W9YQN9_9CNID|nr:hypothetical protein OS493_020675 [Desmophyllum pertusum]